jgi:hypothetical protein
MGTYQGRGGGVPGRPPSPARVHHLQQGLGGGLPGGGRGVVQVGKHQGLQGAPPVHDLPGRGQAQDHHQQAQHTLGGERVQGPGLGGGGGGDGQGRVGAGGGTVARGPHGALTILGCARPQLCRLHCKCLQAHLAPQDVQQVLQGTGHLGGSAAGQVSAQQLHGRLPH